MNPEQQQYAAAAGQTEPIRGTDLPPARPGSDPGTGDPAPAGPANGTPDTTATVASPVLPSRRRRLLILGLIFFVLAGIGTAAARYLYFDNPQRVLGKMFAAWPGVRTLEYDTAIDFKLRGFQPIDDYLQRAQAGPQPDQPSAARLADTTQTPDTVQGRVTVAGKIDRRADDNPLSQTSITAEVDEQTLKGKIGLDLRSTKSLVYFRLTDLPELGFGEASLKNEWFQYETAPAAGPGTDAEGCASYEYLSDTEAEIEQGETNRRLCEERQAEEQKTAKATQLTPEKTGQLQKLFNQHNPLRLTDRLPGERIDGQATHHYRYAIDKEQLRQLIIKSSAVIADEELREDEIKAVNEALNPLKLQGGELWIGKRDYVLRKATLGLSTSAIDGKDAALDLQVTTSFKNFNRPVEVEIPSQAGALEEAFSKLLAEGSADTDRDGLPNYQETTRGTDPDNPDSDGDKHRDGDEVNRGYNPAGPGRLPESDLESPGSPQPLLN